MEAVENIRQTEVFGGDWDSWKQDAFSLQQPGIYTGFISEIHSKKVFEAQGQEHVEVWVAITLEGEEYPVVRKTKMNTFKRRKGNKSSHVVDFLHAIEAPAPTDAEDALDMIVEALAESTLFRFRLTWKAFSYPAFLHFVKEATGEDVSSSENPFARAGELITEKEQLDEIYKKSKIAYSHTAFDRDANGYVPEMTCPHTQETVPAKGELFRFLAPE